MSCAILIPAYNPDEKLLSLLKQLDAAGFQHIVVINDGSDEKYSGIFKQIKEAGKCHLLRHPVNMGKGAALKSGMLFISEEMPQCTTIITADADGQHTPEDIARLAEQAEKEPEKLHLGVRKFDGKVPLRSLLGNKLTIFFIRLLLGMKISDTQTGLRAIPRSFIPELLLIPYNRYEFELEMLLATKRTGRIIAEMPIKTVYIDSNASSHFNPLLDSFKIYIVLFRYILVSLLTAATDYLVYVPTLWLMLNVLKNIPAATSTAVAVAAGRIVGAAIQYTLVRKVVFYSRKPVIKTLPQYIFLVISSGCASYLIMHAIEMSAKWNYYIAKLLAELIIYIANFLIQRDMIFQKDNN